MEAHLKLRKATQHIWTFTISKFISSVGVQVYTFAVSYYILHLTGSASYFAINILCNVLPRTLASPIAGYFVDKYPRKRIVIISHIINIFILFLMIILSKLVGLTLPIFYIATILFTLTSTFAGLAFTSSISGLVDAKRIQKAMSLNQMVISISSIASPAIGGLTFALVNMPVLLTIYLSAVILALILESTMNFTLFSAKQTSKTPKSQNSTMWLNIKEGLVYIKGKPLIISIISIALFINFFAGAFQVGSSFTLINKLKMSSQHFGMIESALAAGMLIVSIYLSIRKELKYPLMKAKYGIILIGLLICIFTLPTFFRPSYTFVFSFYITIMLVYGAALTFINTPILVMLQKEISDEFKGRVFSLLETGAQALVPLSTILFGILYDLIPFQIVMLSAGFSLLIAVLYLARTSVIQSVHPELFEKKKNPVIRVSD